MDQSQRDGVVAVVLAVLVDVVLRVVDAVPLPIILVQISTATDRVGFNTLNGQSKLSELEAIGELDKMLAVVASGIGFWFLRAPVYRTSWSVIQSAYCVTKR